MRYYSFYYFPSDTYEHYIYLFMCFHIYTVLHTFIWILHYYTVYHTIVMLLDFTLYNVEKANSFAMRISVIQVVFQN